MNKRQERRFLNKFKKMIAETKRMTKEAESMKRDAERCMKKRLKKVM